MVDLFVGFLYLSIMHSCWAELKLASVAEPSTVLVFVFCQEQVQIHKGINYFKYIIQQGTEKTGKNMFCFGSVLYWTQSEKFVYTNQQRFAFQIQMLTAICCTYCEVDSLKPS